MRTHVAPWPAVTVALTTLTSGGLIVGMTEVSAQQPPGLEKVRYNMADALGMLRSPREVDQVMSVEFYGRGSMADVGPSTIGPLSELKSYYAEVAFDFPGMRVDATHVSGKREIRVVSGLHAWNEIGERGGGLVEGFGRAEPAMDAVADRLLQIWTLPLGAVKTAVAAGDKAKVSMENGAVVVTYPLVNAGNTPSAKITVGPLEGTPVKLTLDDRYRPVKVEVRHRNRQMVTTYSDYADLNERDYQADIFLPAKVRQTVDGQTVLDLTIEKTNTYNPYVIMPVPKSVQAAAK